MTDMMDHNIRMDNADASRYRDWKLHFHSMFVYQEIPSIFPDLDTMWCYCCMSCQGSIFTTTSRPPVTYIKTTKFTWYVAIFNYRQKHIMILYNLWSTICLKADADFNGCTCHGKHNGRFHLLSALNTRFLSVRQMRYAFGSEILCADNGWF